MEDIHFSSAQVGWIGGGIDHSLAGHPVLLKSLDGGQTWNSIDVASLQISKFITFFPVNDQLLYGCAPDLSTGNPSSPRVMYKSADGGVTWHKLDSPTFAGGSFNLYFFDARTGLSANISTLQQTTDGGVTWRTVYDQSLVGLDKLQCFHSGTAYAGGGTAADQLHSTGILLKSLDQGGSWQKIPWPYGDIVTLSFLNEQVGFVGTLDRHLYKTTDGGASWQLVSESMPPGSRGVFVSEQEGYLAAGDIKYTHDGGHTWQVEHILPTGDACRNIAFSPTGTGLVITNDGLILRK